MKCPCIDCERRHATCHGKCEEYKEWKTGNDKLRERERKERQSYYGDYSIKRKYR